MRPDLRPSMTAGVSISAPRPVLTSITPGFIRDDRGVRHEMVRLSGEWAVQADHVARRPELVEVDVADPEFGHPRVLEPGRSR